MLQKTRTHARTPTPSRGHVAIGWPCVARTPCMSAETLDSQSEVRTPSVGVQPGVYVSSSDSSPISVPAMQAGTDAGTSQLVC